MKHALLLGLLVIMGACSSPSPAIAPAPVGAAAGLRMRDNWRSTVVVQRDDSIVLTMPTGVHQLQRYHRVAGFTVAVGLGGNVSIRLDSLRTQPASATDIAAANGATWTGRLGDPSIGALRAAGGNNDATELTSVVRHLLPRLPAAGAMPKATWRDSATGATSTDVFKVTERRTATWSTGTIGGPASQRALPIQLSEDFEQVGDGSQDYRRITITSQGRRSGTYYLDISGRIRGAELTDSSAMSIGVPELKEVMSGTRVTRTEIRFIPINGDS